MTRLLPPAAARLPLVAVAVAVAAAVAGCGGSSTATAPSSTSVPAASAGPSLIGSVEPSSSAPVATPTTTSAAGRALGAKVIPAPTGYELDPAPGIPNGELPAATLDGALGQPGFAASHGYVTGWSTSYQDQAGDGAEVSVVLQQLGSSAQATAYLPTYQQGDVNAEHDLAPKVGTDAAIPGSVTLTPTLSSQTYAVTYNVLAVKGDVLMDVSFSLQAIDSRAEALVQSYALAQYRRL